MSSSKVESGTSAARLLGRRGMGLGSARTEMVFIGAGLDEAAVRSVLDQCLVSEDPVFGDHRGVRWGCAMRV